MHNGKVWKVSNDPMWEGYSREPVGPAKK
jgi:hypothetical protein